ncbi:MAG: UvrD-helicase domain-containing protein, partial [Myxococcales bacterium]|nr:UvrD-helicase domain-containing protein [Myxococcales bacterium]
SEGAGGGDARTRELLAADARARHVAMTEFDRPVVIEAGAGTGKTATLVGRVVAWSVGRGWERLATPGQRDEEIAARVLDGLVAITFTEAAAAEMAERVAHALAALAVGRIPTGMGEVLRAGDEATAARAAALLTALDHLVVSTIHAFCRRILATYPLEAGLHPAFGVDADGSRLAAVAHEVVEGWLVGLFRRPGGGVPAEGSEERAQHEAMLALAGEGLGPEAIAVALEQLASSAVPVEAVARDAFTDDAVAAVIARVQGAVVELRELLDATVADAGRARNAQAIRAGLAALHNEIVHLEPSKQTLGVVQRSIEEALAPTLLGHLRKHWAHAQVSSAAEAEALGSRAFELRRKTLAFLAARDHAARLRPALYDAARALLAPMLVAVRERLREEGVITFDALLARARDLLADRPDLRVRVRDRIDQLLVDEFQDTDAVQCDLVRLLALAPGPARAPGLFVVGDPKQSIYGWRNADLAAYQGFVDDVAAAGGELGHLAANHRSVAPVLDEVERVVAQVMVPEPGLQPPFRPLVPAAVPRDGAWRPSGARAAVEHWVSWLPDPHEPGPLRRTLRSEEAAALEARALVADLRGLKQESGFSWSDVGLLLRSTSDQDVYLEAMREARIPYVVERDKSYYRRREVIEAAALVRAVLDPTDHLALVTFLRSAWVGVPDAAWIPLWAEGFPDHLTELHRPDDAALAALDGVIARAAAAIA